MTKASARPPTMLPATKDGRASQAMQIHGLSRMIGADKRARSVVYNATLPGVLRSVFERAAEIYRVRRNIVRVSRQ